MHVTNEIGKVVSIAEPPGSPGIREVDAVVRVVGLNRLRPIVGVQVVVVADIHIAVTENEDWRRWGDLLLCLAASKCTKHLKGYNHRAQSPETTFHGRPNPDQTIRFHACSAAECAWRANTVELMIINKVHRQLFIIREFKLQLPKSTTEYACLRWIEVKSLPCRFLTCSLLGIWNSKLADSHLSQTKSLSVTVLSENSIKSSFVYTR